MIPSLCSGCPATGSRLFLRLSAGFAALCFAGAFAAHAATLCVNPKGTSGCKTTINAAVGAASPGDTILVAPGTYKEDVVITQPVALLGSYRASIIDASGLSNGIFVNGMSAPPKMGNLQRDRLRLHRTQREFRGLLVANATDVSLTGNLVTDNNKSLDISASTCNDVPAFETNEGDDCGEGIHLIGSDVFMFRCIDNEVAYNSGGILNY